MGPDGQFVVGEDLRTSSTFSLETIIDGGVLVVKMIITNLETIIDGGVLVSVNLAMTTENHLVRVAHPGLAAVFARNFPREQNIEIEMG